jgi:predicted permease
VGQVALSLVSLVTAGLFLRHQRAYSIDPGFETKRGDSAGAPARPATTAAQRAVYLDVRARVGPLPNVESMSWATNLRSSSLLPRRLVEDRSRRRIPRAWRSEPIDLDYFATLGIRSAGRDFSESDVEGSLPVAIVNEAFARRHWPDRDPLLGRFRFAGEERLLQVVGVARDANYTALGEAPQPCVYLPLRQDFADAVVLYVRARNDAADALAAVQREIRAIDPLLWVSDVRTMETLVDQALFGARIGASLLGVFGILALGLASIGLYGVMAHSVNLRRREVGVRMALGASPRRIVGLVLRQGMGLVVTGIALGLLGSLLAGRALSGLLYGLGPADPLSLGGAAAVLLAVAALACYLPARAASRLDALAALRES